MRGIFDPMRLVACLLLSSLLMLAADGLFKGNWTSSTGAGAGEIRIGFEPQPSVMFTFEGQQVNTKVIESKVSQGSDDQRRFTIVYRFILGETELTSRAEGELKNGHLEGKYRTTISADGSQVDEGKFTAARED